VTLNPAPSEHSVQRGAKTLSKGQRIDAMENVAADPGKRRAYKLHTRRFRKRASDIFGYQSLAPKMILRKALRTAIG
jgi:hypothetical protein